MDTHLRRLRRAAELAGLTPEAQTYIAALERLISQDPECEFNTFKVMEYPSNAICALFDELHSFRISCFENPELLCDYYGHLMHVKEKTTSLPINTILETADRCGFDLVLFRQETYRGVPFPFSIEVMQCNCPGCDLCGTHCLPGCASGEGQPCGLRALDL